jgi:hypothetical protein
MVIDLNSSKSHSLRIVSDCLCYKIGPFLIRIVYKQGAVFSFVSLMTAMFRITTIARRISRRIAMRIVRQRATLARARAGEAHTSNTGQNFTGTTSGRGDIKEERRTCLPT